MRNQRHLPRLPRSFYCGAAIVHWTLTIENRRQGWLCPVFYYKFREILAHAAFRFGLLCPIFCLMPDHIHLLWIGLFEATDQCQAMKWFRREVNVVLKKLGVEFQHQPHDRVLRDSERSDESLQTLVEYIARNPERAGLTPPDGYRDYNYTNCLAPGYPNLSIWERDYWERLWRIHSHLIRNGTGACR